MRFFLVWHMVGPEEIPKRGEMMFDLLRQMDGKYGRVNHVLGPRMFASNN